ncbi:hypothetical protein C8R47DRAFT_1198139 [Mycena vitilis]|nr:hypothetical protein C8R47DRAFT_1198139 [Mycena vitilis]
MALLQNLTVRLLNISDSADPLCPLPALLGPAKQSACFSICNKRLEVDSTAALRYFVEPPQNSNLRDGVNEFMKLPKKDRAFKRARRLDNVFTTCLESENSEELLKAQVVTWRGIVTKLMMGAKLELNVSYHRGVLYLEEDCPRARKRYDNNSEAIYMGHKFESFCSTSSFANPSGDGERQVDGVDLHTLWNAAITRTLGSLDVLLVGEVDCVKGMLLKPLLSPSSLTPLQLVTRKIPGPRIMWSLKRERQTETGWPPNCDQVILINLYSYRMVNISKTKIQSYLLGTQEIFVGSAGIVREVKTFGADYIQPPQDKIDWGARMRMGPSRFGMHEKIASMFVN